MGGKATKKLPSNQYKATRLLIYGWSNQERNGYDIVRIKPGEAKAEFYATWYKFKVKSKKTGVAEVSFDSTAARDYYIQHAIRYSTDKK